MKSKTTNSFEKSIEKLEKISDLLADGSVELEDAIKYYEEGIELSKNCLKILDEAELKVTELKKNIDASEKN